MQAAFLAVVTILVAASAAHGRTLFSSGTSKSYGVCDPEEDVCHGCEAICSQYADDKKLLLSTKCLAECQVDLYNCMEGTLPKGELTGKESSCIKEKLLERIKSDGDLVLKVVYDVPPTFKEFDQLYDEDGIIDQRDMGVAFDLLDGGAAPDGTVIPTSKVQVVWEVVREADQDGNGIVTEAEFDNYESNTHMGESYESAHPTPENKEIAEGLSVTDSEGSFLEVMHKLKKSYPAKGRKQTESQESSRKPSKEGSKLKYFQHLLRLGLRVWRAEEGQSHPITKLADKISKYLAKHPKKDF